MGTVVVRERERRPDGSFAVRLAFDDGVDYDIDVRDPADERDEASLAWYFEEHLRYPFLDKDLERAAEARIAEYGRVLFTQVFGGAGAYDYRRMREQGFDGCRVEVSGSAAFQRLHWEALRDPDLPSPLAVRLPVTRRVEPLAARFEGVSGRTTLNILVVTARPDGPSDVGFRTLSRPLLDALRQAPVPVQVDLVRPGTWDALRDHLDEARAEHGSGWYHVVHFDLHGLFTTQAELAAGQWAAEGLFLRRRFEAFDGEQGFLFFETARDGDAEPVPAGAVAGLLAEHRVPVAVVSACQSAMQHGDEASLAHRLVEAGVPTTVGMAYSVTVSAAARAIPALYGRLAAQADPVAAVHVARRRLFEEPARQAYFNEELTLEDWMLPVLYRQRPVDLRLREMTGPESERFYARQAAVADEPATEYGFVGRDLDVQTVERRLLLDDVRNVLLVRGMAGAGKSALLAHLGWWWQRTGLVDEVFRFSYEDQAWTAGQIVREIGRRLLDPVEQARLDALSEDAQLEKIAGLLRSRRHLLLVDNAESITASPASIPHALPEPEQQRLRLLLGRLRGGRTLALIGSREAEGWLAPGTFTDNVYLLPGLDPQAARDLAGRILIRHGATRHREDPDQRAALDRLIDLLGGYPLPLTAVLPVLAGATPTGVLDDLDTGERDADPVGLVRTAIEYSYGKLDPALQQSLLLLAPFTAVVPTGASLAHYQEILAGFPAIAALGPLDLAGAVEHAVGVGLATPHPHLSDMVQVQPVLPYFLRTRIRDLPHRADAADAHYQFYCGIGEWAQQLLISQAAEERTLGRAVTAASYANLQGALTHALTTAQPVLPVLVPLDSYLGQTQQHHPRLHLITRTIGAYPDPGTATGREEIAHLHHLAGIVAEEQRQFDEAEIHYRTALDLRLEAGDENNAAATYHQLGKLAQMQRQFEQADAHYRSSLDLFLNFGDEPGAASTYHQLGTLAVDRRRFQEAETYLRRSLDLKLKIGDEHGAAGIYHNLGIAAQQQRRFEEAGTHYQHALDLLRTFGDRDGVAHTYYQLGTVAQAQGQFEQADAHYRRSLDLTLAAGNEHGAALAYHQLGAIAVDQRRFEEADLNYRRFLDLSLKVGDERGATLGYYGLGRIAQEQQRFEDAETHYGHALDLFLKSGDEYNAALTHRQLGAIAQGRQRFQEAETHQRHALDLFLKLGDDHSAALIYFYLGLGADRQLRFEESEAHYRQSVTLFLKSGDEHGAALIHHNLGLLTKEQQRFEEAEGHYRHATALFVKTGDDVLAARTYHEFGLLLQELQRFEEADTLYRRSLDLFLKVGDEHGAALTHGQLDRLAEERRR
ncbi:tetratricopeptide repeat protein [Frankia sp. AvcI1]|uniref:CHAT domain-containing tetratricopeptide repeat protein n=1 Tax=Frankia sp. AvcI1 TaxID=573496 RepID=UPI00211963AA|nr:tetratricopeptide repeat protein [Frankia sp. AvcI1]